MDYVALTLYNFYKDFMLTKKDVTQIKFVNGLNVYRSKR